MDLFSDFGSDAGSTRRRSGSAFSSSSPSSSAASSSSEINNIRINKDYARRFEHNKQRTELHRLEEKYGKAAADVLAGKARGDDDGDGDEDDEDDSEDETEDEEGEQVTAEVDAAILRTLAKIRSGDASIYDSNKRVFDEEKMLAASSELLPKATRAKVEKKVTLADYQRSRLKDLMATSQDPALALAEATTSRTRQDEEADEAARLTGANQTQPLSHVQEQEQLRRQVTQAFHTMGDNEDEDDAAEEDGDFFQKRGQADFEDDPEAYKKYLLSSLGDEKAAAAVREALRTQIDDARETKAPAEADASASQRQEDAQAAGKAKKDRKKSSKAGKEEQSNEEFLMNYILNRGWMENPSAAPKLSSSRPSKAARSNGRDSDSGDEDEQSTKPQAATSSGRDWDAEAAALDDAASDASFDDKAEAFEQAFNFRYEAMESGKAPAQVTSYARNQEASVRRSEDKRKREREERRKRKDAEKQEKMAELDRLRELKKRELRDKLKALQEAAGSANVEFDPLKLEGDFDPEEHERMMKAFGDEYYAEDDDKFGDDEKPVWDDDIDIADILAEEDEEDEDEGRRGKKSKKDKKKDKKKKAKAGGEDDEAIDMDADFIDGEGEGASAGPSGVDLSKLSKKERKKLKKKEKALAASGGAGGVDESAMDAEASSSGGALAAEERLAEAKRLADEYRSLEYEDVVGGDLATRFHYTSVPRSDFGLSPVEILLADDAELNDVVGLKQLQPYRRGGSGGGSKKPRDLNKRLREFRRKLDERMGGAGGAEGAERARDAGYKRSGAGAGEAGQSQPQKKRKGKKERMKEKAALEAAGAGEGTGEGAEAKDKTRADADAEMADDGGESAATQADREQRRREKKERKKAEKHKQKERNKDRGDDADGRKAKKAKVA